MKASFALDTRELRSFKLRYNLQKYNNLLNETDTVALFFVVDSLYPEERSRLTEYFLNQKIKVSLVPKKVTRTLLAIKEEPVTLNLLKGQMFLVQISKENFFNSEILKNLLISNKFFLRLVIFEKKLYRKKRIFDLLESSMDTFQVKVALVQFPIQFFLNFLNVLLKVKRVN